MAKVLFSLGKICCRAGSKELSWKWKAYLLRLMIWYTIWILKMPPYRRYSVTMSRGAFCCACSFNFSVMRETTGVHLRRFLAQESRKKGRRKIHQKNNNWSSICDNFSRHFSRCNIDGRGKVLKLLRNVWKEVIFKNQKIVQTTSSLVLYVVVWAIDGDDVISEGCKRPVEEHKRIG